MPLHPSRYSDHPNLDFLLSCHYCVLTTLEANNLTAIFFTYKNINSFIMSTYAGTSIYQEVRNTYNQCKTIHNLTLVFKIVCINSNGSGVMFQDEAFDTAYFYPQKLIGRGWR